MSECLREHEFDALAAAPADDARRRHVETCPRCHARWLALRTFVDDRDVPDGAKPEEARRAIAARVRAELGLDAAAAPPRRARLVVPPPAIHGRRNPWRTWAPVAMAASLALVASLWWLQRPQGTGRVRGNDPAHAALQTLPARIDGGVLQLTWRPLATADSYRLRLLAEDLSPLIAVEVAQDSAYRVPLDSLGEHAASGRTLYWVLAAVRNQRVELETAPQAIHLP